MSDLLELQQENDELHSRINELNNKLARAADIISALTKLILMIEDK